MMHLYVLVPEGGDIVDKIEPAWGASKLRYSGDPYVARGDCIRHAIEHGHKRICVMSSSVMLMHMRCGDAKPARMATRTHGLWTYLDRLLDRYGHVYVPPVAWAKQKNHEYILNPTIPMVAAYKVSALESLDNYDMPFGQLLCANGYDSFTLKDYFYYNTGPTVLDEPGSAFTWRKAYERAINRFL